MGRPRLSVGAHFGRNSVRRGADSPKPSGVTALKAGHAKVNALRARRSRQPAQRPFAVKSLHACITGRRFSRRSSRA